MIVGLKVLLIAILIIIFLAGIGAITLLVWAMIFCTGKRGINVNVDLKTEEDGEETQ